MREAHEIHLTGEIPVVFQWSVITDVQSIGDDTTT